MRNLKNDYLISALSQVLGISRKKLKFIETLPKGEFVFYEGSRIERVQFPKFEGYGRAYEIQRSIIKKKRKGLWEKMKDAFNNKPKEEPSSVGTEIFETEEDREFWEEEQAFDEMQEEEWEEGF